MSDTSQPLFVEHVMDKLRTFRTRDIPSAMLSQGLCHFLTRATKITERDKIQTQASWLDNLKANIQLLVVTCNST